LSPFVGDAFKFYTTPIETATPYEQLLRMKDLPPNLQIQKDPIRFDPGMTKFMSTESVICRLSPIDMVFYTLQKQTLHLVG
jgi:hypothetical protein